MSGSLWPVTFETLVEVAQSVGGWADQRRDIGLSPSANKTRCSGSGGRCQDTFRAPSEPCLGPQAPGVCSSTLPATLKGLLQ